MRFLRPFRAVLLVSLCAAATGLAAPDAAAVVRRVDVSGGSDAGSCGSAASPCFSIQRAVNLSQTGDEILVAAGVYTYQPALDPCSAGDTGVVCIVNERLTLRGGFDGVDWTTPDPAAHPTVIDGQNSRRGILVTRTFPGAPSAALVLAGFTVRNGRAVGGLGGPDGDNGRGGGLKSALSDVEVRDVVFLDNVAQGAATGSGAGGGGAGGGLFSASDGTLPPSEVRLERVLFEGNQALGGVGPDRGGLGLGGGMFVNNATLTAVDVDFDANSAIAADSAGSGGIGQRADALGGGLAILADVTATIDRLTATGNLASGGDAGVASGVGGGAFGGGVYVEASTLTMSDSTLSGNEAVAGDANIGGLGAGGGLMTFDASLDLRRSWLLANTAEGGDGPTRVGSVGGGGAYLERASDPGVTVTLTNCVVADNFVQKGTGGNGFGGGGGGLFLLGNDALLRHLTIARNGLSDAPPLIGEAVTVVNRPTGVNGGVSEATIEYTIVSDHPGTAVRVQPDATAHFVRPLFADNGQDVSQGTGATVTGLASALAAADAGYVSPGPPDFDYHLLLSSPAVDEAPGSQEALDVDRTTRQAPRDIGADEVCGATEDLLLADDTLTGTEVHEACDTIVVRNYTVAGTGDLTLQAGRRLVFENGFAVLSGGELRGHSTLP